MNLNTKNPPIEAQRGYFKFRKSQWGGAYFNLIFS